MSVLTRIVLSLAFLSLAAVAEARDWPSWRGPKRDGVSAEKGLLSEWPKDGPSLLFQSEGLGGGYSSLAIAGGRIYTMGKLRGECRLVCVDQKNGEVLWSTKVGGGDPNCTPTVDGDRVYGLSHDGELLCARTEDGEPVWQLNFGKELGGRMMSGWGYSESPLVDGDRLIVTPGSDDAIIAALDKKTGKVIWKTPMENIGDLGGAGAAYSSVVISEACGIKQYVQLVGRGIVSVAAKDGKFLWGYNRIANGTANIPTPIVKGDHVFCSTGYNTGAALLHIAKKGDALEAEEVYFLKPEQMQNHHGGMVLVGDHVYCGHGHNNGFPLCIEMMTGKATWKTGRGAGTGSAAVVYADGCLYFRYEDGTMALVEANPEEYKLKGSFKLASIHGRSWPHPVIVDGKLYLRDQGTLMVYDIASK